MARDVDPIPLAALVDSIVVTEAQSATAYDNDGETVTHDFNQVLVQPTDKQQITGGSGAAAQLKIIGSYLVFIDRVNSINVDDYVIQIGDTINWQGKKRRVTQVNPMKALLPEPHHWEVLLE